jgi:hypothetical protein
MKADDDVLLCLLAAELGTSTDVLELLHEEHVRRDEIGFRVVSREVAIEILAVAHQLAQREQDAWVEQQEQKRRDGKDGWR